VDLNEQVEGILTGFIDAFTQRHVAHCAGDQQGAIGAVRRRLRHMSRTVLG
jgi:hypothetical protein